MQNIKSHFEKVNNIASKCIIGVEYLNNNLPVRRFATLNPDIINSDNITPVNYNYKDNRTNPIRIRILNISIGINRIRITIIIRITTTQAQDPKQAFFSMGGDGFDLKISPACTLLLKNEKGIPASEFMQNTFSIPKASCGHDKRRM